MHGVSRGLQTDKHGRYGWGGEFRTGQILTITLRSLKNNRQGEFTHVCTFISWICWNNYNRILWFQYSVQPPTQTLGNILPLSTMETPRDAGEQFLASKGPGRNFLQARGPRSFLAMKSSKSPRFLFCIFVKTLSCNGVLFSNYLSLLSFTIFWTSSLYSISNFSTP